MASPDATLKLPQSETSPSPATLLISGIALTVALVHMLTNGRYGFHRDELQTLSDALHLDWGFVAFPPFTPFVERIGIAMFGFSLIGLRLFSVIAQAAGIVVTGLVARELGGGRWAQAVAALGTAVAPLALFEGTEFQYTTFDYLWWVLIAYFMVRLLKTEDPRWCLAIGATIGLGLMTKYSIIFYVGGVVVGLLLSPARRFLGSRWFWMGTALALLIFLPNLIWQFRHDFISLHFLEHIHVRDVGEGRAEGFWRAQFLLCANRYSAPLWIAGLFAYLFNRRYRTLAWMYLVPLAFFWLAKGRGYYVGGAYPMLMAMGATVIERWLARLPLMVRGTLKAAYPAALLAWGVYASLAIVPWSTDGSLKKVALENNGDLREEIGWDDLVKTVAGIRDSLSPEQQNSLGVVVGNYGEQGAIEILGQAYHLPPPLSGTNSAWYRSYPNVPPSTLIVLGFSQKEAERTFASCRLAGHNTNAYGVHNEESDDHPDLFVCDSPRLPWPEFWKEFRRFG